MAGGEIRDPALIAIVLPPREGFSAGAVGAIGLLVHRLAAPGDVILGSDAVRHPFVGRNFVPVRRRFWRQGSGGYVAAAVRTLARLGPALVEVHNRPDLARRAAERLPDAATALFLHNDPQSMRGAKTAAERRRLLDLVRIVTPSVHLQQRFLDGLGGGETALLPNALDLATLPPALPTPARDLVILFAGRVVADKGADAFVQAAALALPRLPGWRAEMLGADRFRADSPETPFLRALRPEAARAGVTLAGYRPHAEVLEAFSRAAIVVVPSRWEEPFGMVALEAMACGAAVLSSGRGGLAEVTGDVAVPIDPDDPAGLAEILVALASDGERRAALSAAGLARARRFDLPSAQARLAALRASWLGRIGQPISAA